MGHIKIDFGINEGIIKPVHGVNNGPICYGSLIDATNYYKDISFPFVRLHDTNWPNPSEVDIHTIFRNFDADPDNPENYDFERTDEYIRSIITTGSEIVYRLGVSIEHTKRKYFIHPPKDFNKWAKICLGIIKHYNDGWAKGFNYGIKYWEIWNEPEGMPIRDSKDRTRLMWTGTNEQYLELYREASTAIKQAYPEIKVGGFAATLTDMEFLESFLMYCKENKLPLDFFSWHKYDTNPSSIASDAWRIRSILDKHGFVDTESHLNEWNYTKAPQGVTEFSQMFGSGNEYNTQAIFSALVNEEGASFDAALLILMQELPIDVANYYDAAPTSIFSLFNPYGVPQKNYYAFKAFKELFRNILRAHTEVLPEATGLYCCASINEKGNDAVVLISNFDGKELEYEIEINNLKEDCIFICDQYVLDSKKDLELIKTQVYKQKSFQIQTYIGRSTVLLIKIRQV